MASGRPQDTHGRAAPGSEGRNRDSARGDRERGALGRDRAERERANASLSRDRGNRGNNPGNPNAPGYLDGDNQLTTMPNGARVPVKDVRNDYIDAENRTIEEKAGALVGGLLGLGEKNPYHDDDYGMPGNPTGLGANYGFDAMQALANFAGMVTGVPFGTGYMVGKYAYENITGNRVPTVNLGHDVLGGATASGQRPTPTGQGGQRTNLNNDKGRKGGQGGNGLLKPKPAPQTSAPPATPPVQPPPQGPSAGGPSKLPKPGQKFQAPSYYAGDWLWDEATQQVVWQPKQNGLLAA
jgi:hypothetical protein